MREMRELMNAFKALPAADDGLMTVEYAVAGGLISLAEILAFTNLGVTVGAVITNINTALGG